MKGKQEEEEESDEDEIALPKVKKPRYGDLRSSSSDSDSELKVAKGAKQKAAKGKAKGKAKAAGNKGAAKRQPKSAPDGARRGGGSSGGRRLDMKATAHNVLAEFMAADESSTYFDNNVNETQLRSLRRYIIQVRKAIDNPANDEHAEDDAEQLKCFQVAEQGVRLARAPLSFGRKVKPILNLWHTFETYVASEPPLAEYEHPVWLLRFVFDRATELFGCESHSHSIAGHVGLRLRSGIRHSKI